MSDPQTISPESKPRTGSDIFCKFLAERYPDQLVHWLFGVEDATVTPVATELSRAPTRADSAILLESSNDLFHIEFQTTARSHAPLNWRMLDYYVGFAGRFPTRRIRQVLVVLHDNGAIIPASYTSETLDFRYQLVKLWEQDPSELLAHDGLLSLAVLCRTANEPEQLLTAVTERIQTLPESERREQFNLARTLAGLRFKAETIYRILQGGGMLEESVIYQDIVRQGLQHGLEKGRQETRDILLRQLTRRCGVLSARMSKQIQSLSPIQLQELGDALLDFKGKKDLTAWLKRHQGTVSLQP